MKLYILILVYKTMNYINPSWSKFLTFLSRNNKAWYIHVINVCIFLSSSSKYIHKYIFMFMISIIIITIIMLYYIIIVSYLSNITWKFKVRK